MTHSGHPTCRQFDKASGRWRSKMRLMKTWLEEGSKANPRVPATCKFATEDVKLRIIPHKNAEVCRGVEIIDIRS
jgi:hypothetical protein